MHATVAGFQQVSQEARGSSKSSSVWECGFHCLLLIKSIAKVSWAGGEGGDRDDTPPSLARKVCGLGCEGRG